MTLSQEQTEQQNNGESKKVKKWYVWRCCESFPISPNTKPACGHWNIKMSKNELKLKGSDYAQTRGKAGEVNATCYNATCNRKKRLNADAIGTNVHVVTSRAHAEKLQAHLNSQQEGF